MDFLPKNKDGSAYEVPKAPSNYLSWEQGANKFRIVSGAIVGYEYWNTEGKPVRLREEPEYTPEDIRRDKGDKVKHFWAFTVIDRNEGKIKVCKVTQASIMGPIKALVDNPEWGDPKGYDITVTKTGEKLETEYNVQPSPHKELDPSDIYLVEETKVNLEALFSGGDPFEVKK